MSALVSPYHERTVTPEGFAAVYDNLTRLRWSGIFTSEIEWQRKEDLAVARFGDFEDAARFIAGLDFPWDPDLPAISREDTPHSLRYRGVVEEASLRMKSMAYKIQFPERQPMGTPVTIRIPLDIINPTGLRHLLASEARYFQKARIETPKRPNDIINPPEQFSDKPKF